MSQPFAISVDVREFNKALGQYAELSRHDAPEIINKVAVDVALTAAKHTPISSREKIMAALVRNSRQETVIGKRGKPLKRKNATYRGTVDAYRILNDLRKNRGEPAMGNRAFSPFVQEFIKGRFSSIGYLKSGFIVAANVLRGRKAKGRGRVGQAIAATTENPEATIFSFLAQKTNVQEKALIRAVVEKMEDLKKEITRRMEKRAKQFSAK